MDLNTIEPKIRTNPLVGREYVFGITDCFEAARDYYLEYFNIDLKTREMFEDDWWFKGIDYFEEAYIKTYGFNKVEAPEVGDMLVFAVNSQVGNHCGIYLGDNTFFHHAVNRLSCREAISTLWVNSLIGVYRYAT